MMLRDQIIRLLIPLTMSILEVNRDQAMLWLASCTEEERRFLYKMRALRNMGKARKAA